MIDDEPDERSQSVVLVDFDLSVSGGCANIERRSSDRRCRVALDQWRVGCSTEGMMGRWMALMWHVQPHINNARKMPSAEAALHNSIAYSGIKGDKMRKNVFKGFKEQY